MPPISEGYDNVGDGARWRKIAVNQYYRKCWPLWGRGVVDLRPRNRMPMVAGRLMRHAIIQAEKMVRSVACEHKIGMCRCSHDRFFFYQEDGSRWSPWLLALLASTKTREGANMMESSLILHFETTAINAAYNYNWTTACDYGGEGPTREDEVHLEHFVYLAVKPLPPTAESMAAAASAQFGDMTRNPEVTRPDNIAAEGLARHLLAEGGGDRPEEDTGA